jgi:hypothetical protein
VLTPVGNELERPRKKPNAQPYYCRFLFREALKSFLKLMNERWHSASAFRGRTSNAMKVLTI